MDKGRHVDVFMLGVAFYALLTATGGERLWGAYRPVYGEPDRLLSSAELAPFFDEALAPLRANAPLCAALRLLLADMVTFEKVRPIAADVVERRLRELLPLCA